MSSIRRFSTSAAVSHSIKSIGVVGAGQMGLGIAYVAAKTARVPVKILDSSEQQLQKSLAFADKLFEKDVAKGKLSKEDADAARARISPISQVTELDGTDLIIEAVSENLPLKQKIFKQLAETVPLTTILGSNTSSISLSTIAAAAKSDSFNAQENAVSASRVVGFHFFNPVPVMPLIELIPALQTSSKTLATAKSFGQALGKTITTSQDTPGFISNRLLMPFINESIEVLEKGIATREDIDATLRLGMGHPMGPLTLADFIGLDTCLAIMQTLQTETGDTKYRPSVLLGRMVAAGWMGKKSGKGFYDYN